MVAFVFTLAAEGAEPASERRVPADDGSVICNHYLPKDAIFPDVRCKDAMVESGRLLFARGSRPSITLPIQNDGAEDIPAEYLLRVMNRQGELLFSRAGELLLPAGGSAVVEFDFDTKELKFGVYSLMLGVTTKGAPLAEREYYVGVVSETAIPKAAAEDFLYGLDPNYGGVIAKLPQERVGEKNQAQCDLLGWVEASGADILRSAGFGIGPGAWTGNLHDLAILRDRGWLVVGMAWPPSPSVTGAEKWEDAFTEKVFNAWIQEAETIARQAPEVRYWEVGNEPDLGYPDINAYAGIYEATYRALKKGNPQAVVMNGGITFFGAKGPPNSRRFLELVKPEMIDAIAFHAHGHGSLSERKIWDQVSRTAREFGKGDKPLIDTESGMFVGSKKQEDIQAWTVVQKQVYAQAVGLQFLMTFRLHAFRKGDLGYGMLRSDQEPMPGFLAYRTMTEHLKSLAWQRNLEMGRAHAEGYSFAARQGKRRVCLFWTNQPAFYYASVKVAARAREVRNVRFMDVYGNPSPAEVSDDGVVRVEVTEEPVYLLWDARDPTFEAAMAPSLIETPDMANIVPGVPSPLEVGIRNSTNLALSATLVASVSGRGHSSITPERQTVTVPAGKTGTQRLMIDWDISGLDCVWPESWRVFTGVPQEVVDWAAMREEPVRLGGVEGRVVKAVNGFVDLLRPGEAPREKQPGFVFGSISSDHDQVVKIACNADWWMEFRLNGELICSTFEKGNEGKVLTERVLDLPLKKGNNLLAIKVLSGKGGWSVTLPSPAELPGLLDPRNAGDFVDLTVEAGGKEIARERLALRPVWRAPWLEELSWKTDAAPSSEDAPDFVLEGANVTNHFDKLPDSSKFWQGNRDLSAEGWIRCDDGRWYLFVRVQDDKDVTAADRASLADSDSLQIGISCSGSDGFDSYRIGRVGGKAAVCKEPLRQEGSRVLSEVAPDEITAHVESAGGQTFYRISLDRRLVGEGTFRLNVSVNDNDEGYAKQFAAWAGGAGQDATLWRACILTESKTAGGRR